MAAASHPPSRLVLYDGHCGFCDRTVRQLLEIDRDGRLIFAPLQGPTAAAILARHPEIPPGLDSIVYVESNDGGERVSWHSEAALRIGEAVEMHSPWLTVARWLPRGLADLAYRTFAAMRYRLFGRLNECRIPAPEQRGRFLD